MKQVNIKLPEDINDLTLGQWQQMVELGEKEGMKEEYYASRMVKIIYGVSEREFKNIVVKDIEIMAQAYKDVINQEKPLAQTFTLNGIEYGLIPNFDNISFGEWVDVSTYGAEKENYHKLMSILYRPITKRRGRRYSIEAYKGSHDLFKSMPLGVALGVLAFFLKISIQLSTATLRSLTREELIAINKRYSQKSGGGTLAFTP